MIDKEEQERIDKEVEELKAEVRLNRVRTLLGVIIRVSLHLENYLATNNSTELITARVGIIAALESIKQI